MLKVWIIRLLIVICTMSVMDDVIIGILERKNQEIVYESHEGIPLDGLYLWVKEVVDYEDKENRYKVGPNNHLIAITLRIKNNGNRDYTLRDTYAPISLEPRPYGDCEIMTFAEDGYQVYDLRAKKKEIMIPMGRTREVTYIVEMHNEAIVLNAEAYEYKTNTRHMMSIPF